MTPFEPITLRVTQPTPDQVKAARKAVKLTQAQAALLVSPVGPERAERAWQGYEVEVGKTDHRAMPLAVWELFLLLTGQHPAHHLVARAA